MDQHDLLLIVDSSSVAGCYLHSLTTSLPEMLGISAQHGCFSRIGVLVYRDYEYSKVLEWSGWLNQGQQEPSQEQQPDLIAFVKRLRPTKGRSYNKAVKTALAKACQVMRANAKTLIFLYAHTRPESRSEEKVALLVPGSYSRYGPAFVDWVSACNTLRDGPKEAQVFTILDEFVGEGDAAWYTYLSTRTDGVCVQVKGYLPREIPKVTVDLLLGWMGVENAPSSVNEGRENDVSAELLRYISVNEIDNIENEGDSFRSPYFSAFIISLNRNDNINKLKLTTDVMKECVPRKTAPVSDVAEEIASIINSVPVTEMYPCVFLDPSLSFPDSEHGTKDPRSRPISYLTRSELLQIGRFCSPSVLRRFCAILTRLTIVASAKEMPHHISSISADHVAKIPLELSSEKYNKQFWKVLLHTIEPGMKLPDRSAALLAALSLRMGIMPLMKVAEQEMLAFKDKWNDPSTPQTWNIGCLTLLIDADEAHQKHREMGLTSNQSRILNPTDRTLFDRLVACKLLEQKIWTPLIVEVPLTPEKTIASVGPLVRCRECQYPRSVTVMGTDGKCGPCLAEYVDEKQKETHIATGVSKDVTASSNATWVECISRSCQAQDLLPQPSSATSA
ncbi:hypothetical protein PITC_002080 [Penicillium italicum]|uniref:Uncharacterized protein n=1 Tax=Penicillium italicum TaxID=40296 RepID=A0A0A2L5V2_PENIT|nr:hypothetical protein PITC_002080 [Penicillium italicum]